MLGLGELRERSEEDGARSGEGQPAT